MAFAHSVGDFLKAKDIGIEGGACIHIPHIERDMMQDEKVGHCQAPLPIRKPMMGLCKSAFEKV